MSDPLLVLIGSVKKDTLKSIRQQWPTAWIQVCTNEAVQYPPDVEVKAAEVRDWATHALLRTPCHLYSAVIVTDEPSRLLDKAWQVIMDSGHSYQSPHGLVHVPEKPEPRFCGPYEPWSMIWSTIDKD